MSPRVSPGAKPPPILADMENSAKSKGERRTGIIKEGGYQPTKDPGPVPTSLVRPTTANPAPEKPATPKK